jgi:ubiquitin C-terminal hydrolase
VKKKARSSGPRVSEPRVSEPRVSEPRVSEPRVSGEISDCDVCKVPGADLVLLGCSACSVGRHVCCCRPRLLRVPEEEWYCSERCFMRSVPQISLPSHREVSYDHAPEPGALHFSLITPVTLSEEGSVLAPNLQGVVLTDSEPIGLVNLGNSCFFNSLMQALASAAPELCSLSKLTDQEESDEDHQLLPTVGQLVTMLVHSSRTERRMGALDLSALFRLLKQRCRAFSGRTQEDVHEAMTKLLDFMLSDERSCAAARGLARDTVVDSRFDLLNGPCISWRVFGSQTEGRTQCEKCSCLGELRREDALVLTLPLPSRGVTKLGDLLKSEFLECSEVLSDAQCQGCGSNGLTKVTRAVTLPPVLCVLLKRYETVFEGGRVICKKKQSEVEVPLTLGPEGMTWAHCEPLLDLALDPMSGRAGELKAVFAQSFGVSYELYGVVCHLGSGAGSGHYVAHVRRKSPLPGSLKLRDQWFLCDDERVKGVDLRRVLHDARTLGYVLMYKYKDPENYPHVLCPFSSSITDPEVCSF